MINKRLFNLLASEKKKIYGIVTLRVINLACSILFYLLIANTLYQLYQNQIKQAILLKCILATCGLLLLKIINHSLITKLGFQASTQLRLDLREKMIEKAFQIGPSAKNYLSTSELTQISIEGIEQLEIYYSQFIPQFFYSLIASLVVFASLAVFNLKAATILLICVPLIPISIMAIMKIAKRVLKNYWNDYLNLGEVFFENLKGLTTLKSFQQDGVYHQKMNQTAETFRKATMRLLSMQLNSITIMDIIAYTGSAIGISLALIQFANGQLSLIGAVMFLLLSAEFFIPLRQLGSLFHVAMTGMSASDRLFNFLDLEKQAEIPTDTDFDQSPITQISLKQLAFQYPNEKDFALEPLSVTFKRGELTAIIGKSGSGKSTLAAILAGFDNDYHGKMTWNQTDCQKLAESTKYKQIELINSDSFLFSTTIRENLTLENPQLTDRELWGVLSRVNLKAEIEKLPNQLDFKLLENGQNLSGGQRQRLLLARSLLSDKAIYIFDEITSSLDLTNEKTIMAEIEKLAQEKIVILISHRLYNLLNTEHILVLEQGRLTEEGSAKVLQAQNGFFKTILDEETTILQGGVS